MPRFNQADTRTPRHLRDRAERLRDEANGELDETRRKQKRSLADDLEQQARDAERLKG